ncbi:Methyltransferase type 11 [Segniliparus rotundus DSM 44985]|uniref:Methyltransferase type 11 n=1 Tax=Segniliparus rotundus (strain ATCC BAA-972 / CDC 1076 / CIP 108378 / DSM 44985 / JCM 13578) TaxID=640132 RepID=D6ZEH2_SEGRD|nr:class I SAM-dependent methyltransferase [Segniliparus rotundus]ADG99448.1 Methyltransferase type 11 [Segniliparus rotundus DSM 44985]
MGATSYALNAEFWIDIIRRRRDRYRTELTDVAVLSMVGAREGLRALDAGCGEGYLSRALAERGAHVVGVDSAAELVEAARLEAARLRLDVEHRVADIGDLPAEFSDVFDVVVFNHVVNDLEDPAPAFAEAARVLRPGGRAVVLMLHPCFTRQGVAVQEYFANDSACRCFDVDGVKSPVPVTYWLRPLESYSALLVEAGFAVTGLQEPRPSAEQMLDPWWQEHFSSPKFLLVEARKLV